MTNLTEAAQLIYTVNASPSESIAITTLCIFEQYWKEYILNTEPITSDHELAELLKELRTELGEVYDRWSTVKFNMYSRPATVDKAELYELYDIVSTNFKSII